MVGIYAHYYGLERSSWPVSPCAPGHRDHVSPGPRSLQRENPTLFCPFPASPPGSFLGPTQLDFLPKSLPPLHLEVILDFSATSPKLSCHPFVSRTWPDRHFCVPTNSRLGPRLAQNSNPIGRSRRPKASSGTAGAAGQRRAGGTGCRATRRRQGPPQDRRCPGGSLAHGAVTRQGGGAARVERGGARRRRWPQRGELRRFRHGIWQVRRGAGGALLSPSMRGCGAGWEERLVPAVRLGLFPRRPGRGSGAAPSESGLCRPPAPSCPGQRRGLS